MRLLLFSNSTNAGEEYLSYAIPHISTFLPQNVSKGVFIPFAGISVGMDKYYDMVSSKFESIGLEILSAHASDNIPHAINEAGFIVIGGGNTFCLLKKLQDLNLLDIIKEKVKSGMPYIGWSAGSNVSCPTIKTTNDMPIVEPDDFTALDLIPFQINPHYTDFKMKDHAGETREMRIEEFLIANNNLYVVGLREGTFLKIEEGKINLYGERKCRIFKSGMTPVEKSPGENIQFLMQ